MNLNINYPHFNHLFWLFVFLQIYHLKERARLIAELPEKDFDVLVASLNCDSDHQSLKVIDNSRSRPKTDLVSCHMAASEAAVGTNVGEGGKTQEGETSPLSSDDSAATGDSMNEATVSESRTCDSAITNEKSTNNSLKLKNNIPTNKVDKIVQENKEPDSTKKDASQLRTNSLVQDSKHSNDVIGATISFGLGQNSVVKTSSRENQKHVEQNARKETNLPLVQPPKTTSTCTSSSAGKNKQDALSGSPHSPEDLLAKSANLVTSAGSKSSTCPPPKFLDTCDEVDHSHAVTLNDVSSGRTMGHRSDSSPEETAQPVEREMQPLSKKGEDTELQGLFNSKLPKNYGSIEYTKVVSPLNNVISSPDEETFPAACSTAESREVLVGSVGPETADGASKKKKKKKKKKKGK